MADPRYAAHRFLLKDTIRQQIDFSQTGQSRGLPPPPRQQPCAPDLPRIPLPDGRAALGRLANIPLGEAILRRESVRRYAHTPLTLAELSLLLFATQGVRQVLSPAVALRTVPSAGARHAFETYLAVSRVDGLEPGLYRYLPFDSQLAQLRVEPRIHLLARHAGLNQPCLGAAAVSFLWTAVAPRMEWRYDLAAHKVIAVDAGHVGQNLYLACEAIDCGACVIAAYDQEACDQLLGVDGEDEFTVYLAAVGKR